MGDWGRLWLDQEASVHAAGGNMLLWVLGQNLNTRAIPKDDVALQFCLEDEALDRPQRLMAAYRL